MRSTIVLNSSPVEAMGGHHVVNGELVQFCLEQKYELQVVVVSPRYRSTVGFIGRLPPSVVVHARNILYRRIAGRCIGFPTRLSPISGRRHQASSLFKAGAQHNSSATVELGCFANEPVSRWAYKEIMKFKPDLVLIDTVFLSAIALRLPIDVRRLLISHDVMYQRRESFVGRGHRVQPFLDCDMERELLASFDEILALTRHDADEFRRMAPGKKVHEMPIRVRVEPSGPAAAGNVCLFVGNGSAHNVDGLKWLTQEVWPKVLDILPDAILHVAGAVSEPGAPLGAGIVAFGVQQSLEGFYADACIGLIPLKAGSGLKIKGLGYLASSLPIVSTVLGSAGFEDSGAIRIANEPAHFAAEIVLLLSNDELRRTMAVRATAFARRQNEKAERAMKCLFEGSG